MMDELARGPSDSVIRTMAPASGYGSGRISMP